LTLRFYLGEQINHNPFNYIFFLGWLADKDSTEHTGHESFVANQVKSKSIGWFPNMQGLGLKVAEDPIASRVEDIKLHSDRVKQLKNSTNAAKFFIFRLQHQNAKK
jgi:inositol 1,4,5-triphosphate receptor type 1